jgi:RimJ/RimL family protein N-acetyltransferase
MSAEFGIMIDHKFWGTKSVLEAIYLCFEYFYNTLQLSAIETAAFTTNHRSRALMKHIGIPLHSIKRNVMVLEGESKDDACYVIKVDQWPKIKAYLRSLLYR